MNAFVTRWSLLTACAILLLDLGLRIGLMVAQHAAPTVADQVLIIGGGFLRDVAVLAVTWSVPVLILGLAQPPIFRVRWFRWVAATIVLGVASFISAVEWFFFDEFSSRFNHIALDYVLFPYEVLTNIWESYNIPLFTVLALVVGAVLALPHLRGAPSAALQISWRGRLKIAGGALVLGGFGLLALWLIPDGPTSDRRMREVAANGVQSLARAALTSHLEYDAFYATGDDAAAQATLTAARVNADNQPFPQRRFTAVGDPGVRRPDVVVILEESLGADFIGCLGGNKKLSPGFDRWAEKGLLFTNLYATGNRTVRGLEGVLCSFPPLPGDSIVKRDRTTGAASLAQVFAKAGYQTEFVYGGAGSFDNLRNFADATGYQAFHEDGVLGTGVYPREAFRTAWGVADGPMFDQVLARQRAAAQAAERKPLFLTALTVSNHKPYLLPPGHGTDDGGDTSHALRYALIGVGLLVLCGAIVIWGRRIVGLGLALGFTVVILGSFSIYVFQRVKPSGTREQAVLYATNSVAEWLDRAQAEGLLQHTVVLIVGDHGARVYGAEQVPIASYRVPALLLTPETAWAGKRVERLASQIDLAPTLLSLAGLSYVAPFFGDDLLSQPTGPGRAFLQHNRDIAVMDDRSVVAFGLQKRIDHYERTGAGGSTLKPLPAEDPVRAALQSLGMATYQMANRQYLERTYRLP